MVSGEVKAVAELIDAFLAWCGRHRAAKTVQFYRGLLASFRRKYAARPFATLTPLEVDAFLHETGQRHSDSTRRHNAVALHSLQSFALREKLLDRPVFGRLEKPRMGRRERVPTESEIARLLEGAPPAFVRIYRALCQSGARPGELCRLTIADVDRAGGACTLAEHKTARKSGKPRIIPIGEKFGALLAEAIGSRTDPAAHVFLTDAGKPWTVERLSALHRRLRNAAGLDGEIVLYLARHRFGTRLIEAGQDIKTVADLMGHASVKTTERYVHRDVRALRGKQDLIE